MQLTATKTVSYEIKVKGKLVLFHVTDTWNGFAKLYDPETGNSMIALLPEPKLSSGITAMFNEIFDSKEANEVGLIVVKGTPSLIADLKEDGSGSSPAQG